jgi:dTDP-4-dehydrorhamnose reductase
MLGRAVCEHFTFAGDRVIACDHHALDIGDYESVRATLRSHDLDVVINCAAWTDVDSCELDQKRAFAANAQGPENLARVSKEIGATLITISTDYVFDGEKNGFYTQRDAPNPESVYGRSKLDGELRAQAVGANTIIVRSGFIFDVGGTNFLSTIVERARRGERLKAIGDAWGTPTYAPDLAKRLREFAILDVPGIFHATNAGDGATYLEFTRTALEFAGYANIDVENVSTDSLNRLAKRPKNSRLKCMLSEFFGLSPLPFWKDSLGDFVSRHFQGEAPKGLFKESAT